MLHEICPKLGRVLWAHAKAAARCCAADALRIVRPVDVVVRLAEEDLHRLHRTVRIASLACLLPLCPWAVRRDPRRVPDHAANGEVAARRGMTWQADGDAELPNDPSAVLDDEPLLAQTSPQTHTIGGR